MIFSAAGIDDEDEDEEEEGGGGGGEVRGVSVSVVQERIVERCLGGLNAFAIAPSDHPHRWRALTRALRSLPLRTARKSHSARGSSLRATEA